MEMDFKSFRKSSNIVFPPEILIEIFHFLEVKEVVLSLSLVSKSFREASEDHYYFENLTRNLNSESTHLDQDKLKKLFLKKDSCWKKVYIYLSKTYTFSERNRIGIVDLEELLQSKDEISDIHVPCNDTCNGGACYGPKRDVIWSTYGREGNGGNHIHRTDVKTNTSVCYEIPISTWGYYPLFDEKRDLVYVFSYDGQKEFVSVDHEGKSKKFTPAPFRLRFHCVPLIFGNKIWIQSDDYHLCFYNLQTKIWRRTSHGFSGLVQIHEYDDRLWIVGQEVVHSYDIEKDELQEEYTCLRRFFHLGNSISFSLLHGENGFVIFQYTAIKLTSAESKWRLVDPVNKWERYISKWHENPNTCTHPGHWFLKSKTGELYFNCGNKWRVVKLKKMEDKT